MAQASHPEDNRLGSDPTLDSADRAVKVAQAAQAEKAAAARIPVNAGFWVLAVCVVVYVVAMFLPFAAGVSGWQFLRFTEASTSVQAKVTEYVFVWLSCAGLGVLTTIALATRRFAIAAPAWMLTAVSLFSSTLAIWLRRTSGALEQGYGHGIGMYLAVLAVLVATFAFIPVITRRDAKQQEMRAQRTKLDTPDEVAQAQQQATKHAQEYFENPLLIDDRRARAAERHRRRPTQNN